MTTWEERMSQRARDREAVLEERVQIAEDEQKTQQSWMHGWPRLSSHGILIGTGVHCVCCGRCEGVTCVAFTEDWEPPGPHPDWPFGEQDCPLCTVAVTYGRGRGEQYARDTLGPNWQQTYTRGGSGEMDTSDTVFTMWTAQENRQQ